MFRKYSSIENHYRQKYILNCISQKPGLENAKFVAREKIDGANIQIYFKKGHAVKFGKRSSFLSEGDSFFNIEQAKKDNYEIIKRIDTAVQGSSVVPNEIRLYGELYGPGINGRVDYGNEVRMSFFDVELDNVLQTQQSFEEFCSFFSIKDKIVPLIGYYDSLMEALQASCNFNSKILDKDNNPAEGIVIKSYDELFTMGNGSVFVLKKKSDAFKEKETGKKGPKPKENLPEDVIRFMLEFRSYVTKNRLIGIFSKHGEIQEVCQMGKYIQLLIEDAREDFLKDNTLPDTIDKKLEKKIFNVGGHAANLLKEYL